MESVVPMQEEQESPSESGFPLYHMQAAYFVGQGSDLPLSTTARFYRELAVDRYFDPKVAETMWNRVVARHDMLRAVISEKGRQIVLDDVSNYHIVHHDLSDLSKPDQDGAYCRIRDSLMERPLPPDSWPQFCVESSTDGKITKFHIRINIWMVDAVSVQVITAEWLRLCREPDAELPPPNNVFKHFIESEGQSKSDGTANRSLAYWKKRTQSVTLPPGPDLPMVRSPEEIEEPEFTHLSTRIPADSWTAFVNNANKNRVTPSVAVLAVYATVLARWCKSKHFTVTLLLSKRSFTHQSVDDTVGNFGTTLLLEIDVRDGKTIAQLASSIQKQLWRDMKHLDVSGIEVSREVNRVRGTPMALVAPVTFTSLMSAGGQGGWKESELEHAPTVNSCLAVPQVYLDHQIFEEPLGYLIVNWDFVGALFPEGMVEDMFDTYLQRLNSLAENYLAWDHGTQIELPVCQQDILRSYNQTDRMFEYTRMDTLVEQQAAKRPQNTAVVNGSVRLSYGELTSLSNSLARTIVSKLPPGNVLVAISLPKGWAQIVAVLGIMKAGCAYVPIDPELPERRRKQLLEQSDAVAVVTASTFASSWNGSVPVIVTDDLPHEGEVISTQPSGVDQIAYVIFTSGSTGIPKGVVIDHRGAVNTILDIRERMGLSMNDKVLALSSLSFDLSVYDVFGILSVGGTIVIPTTEEQQNPEAWCRLIANEGISVWNSVPALFQLVVDHALQTNLKLPTLKTVMLSGDWIPRKLPEVARKAITNATIFSLGGATEASIWSVSYTIGTLDESWKTIPYGRPLANQYLYVLDEELEQCPLWKAGDLYIGGMGVALGYLNDEIRTNESYIVHPKTRQRLYRTGDLARVRPDGNMEFLGRNDHQIKIRGFRIELGEIESVMVQLKSVAVAVAKVYGTDDANKRLIAFVVPEPGHALLAQDLNTYISERLPKYMVPDAIHIIDVLPLTSNGKVDHKQLDIIHETQFMTDETDTPTATAPDNDAFIESMRKVWSEILLCPVTDSDTGFFALGGTSFQALQLISKVRKQFGVGLSMSALSTKVSVREMAALVREKSDHGSERHSILVLKQGSDPKAPAVFCIHPVGGNAHCYLPLSEFVDSRSTVYGISTPTEFLRDDWNVHTMAKHYCEGVIETAPSGPYIVIGWSMGAAVAAEVARHLSSTGRTIQLVAMIDPYRGNPQELEDVDSLESLFAFSHDLSGLANRHFVVAEEQIVEWQTLDNGQQFEQVMLKLSQLGILPEEPPIEELRSVFDVFVANTKALLEYEPEPLDMDVSVFYADSQDPMLDRRLTVWRPAAREVWSHVVHGNHFTMMQAPGIQQIAKSINNNI
jgi:amino acid adenylation domain-containing protein